MLAALVVLASTLSWSQSSFVAGDPAWRLDSARPEIAPRGFVARAPNRGGPGALALSGAADAVVAGGWERRVSGVAAGRWYRLIAYYRTEGVAHESWQVLARLDWLGADERRVGQPDYARRGEDAAGWRRLTLEAPAPDGALAVKVQLQLRNSGGAVYWDDLRLDEIPSPAARPVTIAAVRLRPEGSPSSGESVSRFVTLASSRVPAGVDVILFPEGMTLVGTKLSYAAAAEPVPGPTTAALAALARSRRAWVAGGLYEREGKAVYNTAVLLDRGGRLAGRYRKVYLPREEVEGGLAPGSAYPAFTTDFGTVGLMICWDVQYPEAARALALAGAELLLVPIWGGNEALGKARAIENRVFLASSGYDYPTQVIDPDGRVLARAEGDGTVALTTVDLSRRYVDPWLGQMRDRLHKELRSEVR